LGANAIARGSAISQRLRLLLSVYLAALPSDDDARGKRANYPRGLIHRLADPRHLAAACKSYNDDDKTTVPGAAPKLAARRIQRANGSRRFSVHLDPASSHLSFSND